MLPKLYDQTYDMTYLNRNGYGFFDKCLSCEVTEGKNGNYYLEMAVDSSDRLAKTVSTDMFIKAKPNDDDPPQLFAVNELVSDTRELRIQAQHIKNLAYQNHLSRSFLTTQESGTPSEIVADYFSSLVLPNHFNFYSDITDTATIDTTDARAMSLGELFGDSEGGLLNAFGGEYHYDNFRIELLRSRGRMSGERIVFGGNLSDYEQTLTNDAAYSHLIGFAKVMCADAEGKHTVFTGDTVVADSQRVFPKVKLIDFTEEVRNYFGQDMKYNVSGQPEYYNTPRSLTTVKIQNLLTSLTLQRYRDTSIYHENSLVGIDITYREALQRLTKTGLCDTLKIITGNNSSINAQITEVTYDALMERYISMTVGEARISLPTFIKTKRR